MAIKGISKTLVAVTGILLGLMSTSYNDTDSLITVADTTIENKQEYKIESDHTIGNTVSKEIKKIIGSNTGEENIKQLLHTSIIDNKHKMRFTIEERVSSLGASNYTVDKRYYNVEVDNNIIHIVSEQYNVLSNKYNTNEIYYKKIYDGVYSTLNSDKNSDWSEETEVVDIISVEEIIDSLRVYEVSQSDTGEYCIIGLLDKLRIYDKELSDESKLKVSLTVNPKSNEVTSVVIDATEYTKYKGVVNKKLLSEEISEHKYNAYEFIWGETSLEIPFIHK